MKRADISLQVVVIAIISLIVLVVLALIFTGKVSIFNTSTSSCEEKGGKCVANYEDCKDGAVSSGFKCKNNNNHYCCIPLTK